MAKDKSKSGMKNKHLHARIAFLHKAATHLTEQHESRKQPGEDLTEDTYVIKALEQPAAPPGPSKAGSTGPVSIQEPSSGGLPLYLSSHLSQVARKSQIRLSSDVKHSICKRCGTIQVEGETCKKFTENLSKGGKKPRAAVLVQECSVCGAKKRWPVGAERQRRKSHRNVVSSLNEIGKSGKPEATVLRTNEG